MILLARPYSQFVTAYDGMVGVEFFQRVRRAVAALVRRYEIRFWGRRIRRRILGSESIFKFQTAAKRGFAGNRALQARSCRRKNR